MSFTSRRIGRSPAVVFIVCAAIATVCYGQGTLDQENNPVSPQGTAQIVSSPPFSAQTFVPSLPYLVGVETSLVPLLTSGGDVVTLTVVGQNTQASTSAFIPWNFQGFWRFDLPGVQLTPGESATMWLQATRNDAFSWQSSLNDEYPNGALYILENPVPNTDTLFRTYGAEIASATLADLEGTWDGNSLASGASSEPWWFRTSVPVLPDGTFTSSGTENDGSVSSVSGSFEIASDGSILMHLDPSKTTPMYLDAGKTVMTTSSTWTGGAPGTTDMAVLTKSGASYRQADLAGTWESNSLATGPGAPWWERSTAVIQSNGAFTYTATYNDDAPETRSGVLTLSRSGVVTLRGNRVFRGNLDAGKTVLVTTDTWPSDGTTELKVILKKADSYFQSDLTGSWQGNTLASGPGAPWWSKSSVTINTDGTYVESSVDSDAVTTTTTGTMSISTEGIITFAGNPGPRGVMDAHKTVMAFTSTRPADGTTELKILTKNVPPSTVAASFSGSPTSGKAPLKVTFNDTSTGAITSRHWDFGDGKTSTQQNPVYTYRKAGNYNVTLTASGPGGTSTVTQTAYVRAYALPRANFVATPRRGSYPLDVAFTNKSTGSIETFAWTFGDGSSSSDPSPTHQYTSAGTFNATLTVTGPLGSSTKSQKIPVTAPR
ncbi:MAG: PKD domain-containing protein [Syntrophobacteraceae bacterium]